MDYEYYEHMRNRLRHGDSKEAEYLMHDIMRDMEWREHKMRHQQYSYRNIIRSIMIFLVIVVVGLSIYLLPSYKGLLEAEKGVKQYQAKGIEIIPNLEGRIDVLDKKITTLTTKEISERLNRIERAIKAGDLDPDDVKTLQELREDFNVLKEYMFSDPTKIVEYRALQKNYSQLKNEMGAFMERNDVIREIDNIRNLLYLTLALVGIFISIFGVTTFNARSSQKNSQLPTHDIAINKEDHVKDDEDVKS